MWVLVRVDIQGESSSSSDLIFRILILLLCLIDFVIWYRLVVLRVHPMFTLLHPTESFVSFTSINGSKQEVWPESGEQTFEGDDLPDGEWMLCDKCVGLGLINRFDTKEVYKCMVHWGTGTVNLELWSEERPVSKDSPLKISHQYEVRRID